MVEQKTETEEKVLDICRRLKKLRYDKGLSQRDVAYAMGVAQPNYNRLENGKYIPKMSTIFIWAEALGYQVELELKPDPHAFTKAFNAKFGGN